ncbi:hypothetical protein [Halobacillus litoralis]|uniref:hypothetical protein n=1 Tax=Halobacillus litoralis TaxID=45668 RepID=UPI001CD6FF20|nr:hypothetical protein [Halobacillus litoralis]MCA1021562.1 hypothetical protein [Halobacillus litoralis]
MKVKVYGKVLKKEWVFSKYELERGRTLSNFLAKSKEEKIKNQIRELEILLQDPYAALENSQPWFSEASIDEWRLIEEFEEEDSIIGVDSIEIKGDKFFIVENSYDPESSTFKAYINKVLSVLENEEDKEIEKEKCEKYLKTELENNKRYLDELEQEKIQNEEAKKRSFWDMIVDFFE